MIEIMIIHCTIARHTAMCIFVMSAFLTLFIDTHKVKSKISYIKFLTSG